MVVRLDRIPTSVMVTYLGLFYNNRACVHNIKACMPTTQAVYVNWFVATMLQ